MLFTQACKVARAEMGLIKILSRQNLGYILIR